MSSNERGDEADALEVVASVWDVLEADIIVGRLQDEGIQAIIQAESLSSVLGLSVDGLGRRDVLVRERDADRARRVLAGD